MAVNHLYQYSIFSALMQGLAGQEVPIKEALQHGDLGIGTVPNLNGEFTSGFSVAGFHVHFVSEDRTCGGHVLDFEADGVNLRAAVIQEYQVALPLSGEFHEAQIESAEEKSLHAAQGS
ncbi:alpha-acetolactate decarboxylase-domain-containing protein [Aspergillus leporis]|uniref:Alpha-acetolactate decarboxylase n=1 Tax=Aspergillus leporis TaxID=41062 RepID=A0A5N5XG10_9EURO|nr:alpha-acetolactate decarboxylase-domain-containing protein [Aspergillus leporis]